MEPMLASPSSRVFSDQTDVLESVLQSPRWAVEPKMDGRRALITGPDGPRWIGRDGQKSSWPLPGAVAETLNEVLPFPQWVVDGELVDGVLWVFDLVQLDGYIQPEHPWSVRRQALAMIMAGLPASGPVRLVPAAAPPTEPGPDDRLTLWVAHQRAGGEGVVLKDVSSPYLFGKRPRLWVKVKWTKTVDCVVRGFGVGGKNNIDLGLWAPGEAEPVNVGEVSRLTGDGPRVQLGDVVEVTVLGATKGGRLREPVTARLRADKQPQECTIDQLDEIRINRPVTLSR